MKKAASFVISVLILVSVGFVSRPPEAGAAPADWENKWESILAKARKEGTVNIYTLWPPKVRAALTENFRKRYGINLEFSTFGRAEELAAKVQREQSAGLYTADVFGCSNSSLFVNLKPLGLLGQTKPLLVLPEVLDAKAWIGGSVPFTDKGTLAFTMIMNAARLVVYNTNLVKQGEITTVKDLLKPQYKGKITLNDPTVSGAGSALMAHLGYHLWGNNEAMDFLKRLVRDQGAVIQRDNRLQIESVARGKYAIALGESPSVVDEFVKAGAPIKLASVKEDNRASASHGAFGVPTRFAHPNATIIFLNWLLTKEGQSIFATTFGQPSIRIDASKEGLNPDIIPIPGEKYYSSDNEDFMAAHQKWLKIAKQIIEESKN